jgi:hypothetical protein
MLQLLDPYTMPRRVGRAVAWLLVFALQAPALTPTWAQAPGPAATTSEPASAPAPVASGSAPASAATSADLHASHRQASGPAGRKVRPTLAVNTSFAPDGALWVVGVDQGRKLWLRRSIDVGRTWSEPRVVDTGGASLIAEGDSRPSIAFGPRGQMVVSWAQPLARPYTGEIRMARSIDGGASFSAPFTVHADRQDITHRFQSIGFDAQGVLHSLWIDKRDAEAARAASGGRRDAYVGAAIYRNESLDGGATFGPDLKVAEHSCECCRIALAPAPDGRLAALWRHVFDGERDHAFELIGASAEPVRASQDGWKLDVCPHHGPGLTPATAGGYHAVWFGERAGQTGVRYGRLDAAGRPQGAVQRLPDAAAEHADVISQGERVAVVWRSFDGERYHLRAWLSKDDGASFELREVASTTLDNDHPRLAAAAGRMVAVWRTEDGLSAFKLEQ